MSPTKVLLINPPLDLLYLAGTLKKHKIKVGVIDGFFCGWRRGVREKIKSYQPTIIGIPCLTPARYKSYQVAKIAKKIDCLKKSWLVFINFLIPFLSLRSNE